MRRILAVGLLASVAACRSPRGDQAAAAETRVPVSVAPVRRDTITDEVRLVGRLVPVPGGQAQLTSPADAVVRRVLVQVGDRVAAGTMLVQLESPELESRAEESAAAAAVARQDEQRQADLFVQGITSRKQLEERQASATAAESAARAARALLQRASVTSPIRGAVQRVPVHAGERVAAGAPLVEIVDGSRLDLVAQVPAGPLGLLHVGQAAQVIPEGSSTAAPGRVVAIAPAVDSLTNAASVIVRVPNAAGSLRAGTGAVATIVAGTRHDVRIVPDSALVLVGDSMTVFVVGSDSLAHARTVGIGVRQGGRVEVTGELDAGDHVVVGNAFGLSDGMPVTVVAPGAE
jgi:RND family efflux transporter MFP subunit